MLRKLRRVLIGAILISGNTFIVVAAICFMLPVGILLGSFYFAMYICDRLAAIYQWAQKEKLNDL